jgi:hypothetical protein
MSPIRPQLVVGIVLFNLLPDVREDAIALPFADVEGLPIARVDEPVDIGLELLLHTERERMDFFGHLASSLRLH